MKFLKYQIVTLMALMLFIGFGEARAGKLWSRDLRPFTHLRADWSEESQPAFYNGTLYAASIRGEVKAFEADSGRLIWKKRLRHKIPYGLAADASGVYLGLDDGTFRSLAASDGAETWRIVLRSAVVSRPTVGNGVVYFMTGDDSLYAADVATGQWKWQYTHGNRKQITILGLPAPILVGEAVIVGLSDGALAAFNAKSGELLWGTHVGEVSRFTDLDATPVITNEDIFVASYEGGIFGLSLKGGSVLWKKVGGSVMPLAATENMIFYADRNGKVHALNKLNGEELWTASCPHKAKNVTGPVIVGGNIAFSDNLGHIHILDPRDGKIIETHHIWGGIHATPLVVKNRLFLVNGRGTAYAFEIH